MVCICPRQMNAAFACSFDPADVAADGCQGAHWPAPSLNIPSPELASHPGESHPQALLERETLASYACVECGRVGLACPLPGGRKLGRGWCRGLPEPLEDDLDLLIAGRHLGLMNVVEFHRLRQGEDVFLSVVAQPAPDIPLAGCEFQAPQNA